LLHIDSAAVAIAPAAADGRAQAQFTLTGAPFDQEPVAPFVHEACSAVSDGNRRASGRKCKSNLPASDPGRFTAEAAALTARGVSSPRPPGVCLVLRHNGVELGKADFIGALD
jgi:hypothetical protein